MNEHPKTSDKQKQYCGIMEQLESVQRSIENLPPTVNDRESLVRNEMLNNVYISKKMASRCFDLIQEYDS